MAWVTLGLSANHWYHARGIVSGYMIGGVLTTFVIFSIEPIRRKFWEFFMKLHWLLICCMLVSCIIHEVGAGILAIGYFALDVICRIYTIKKYSYLSASIEIERVGDSVVKISMHRQNITFKGGQYFFIMIPKMSYFQWHPFSAFSAPHEEQLVFYVKQSGDWTEALFQLAGKQGKPVNVRGYIDGPYGSHSISLDRDKYQHFLCISGGIGITPIFSLVKQLNFQVREGRLVQNIHFIWVGRDKSVIENILDETQLKQLEVEDNKITLRSYLHFTNSKVSNVIKQKQNQGNIKYILGRPDFSAYFENMHKIAKQSQTNLVAVLVCGPQSLIFEVENHASKYSKDGIRFDIHQEVFEL
ncbi:ferric reductase-like transmembrane component family protein (macronuclear) [Tetrahymena thermophila SB210]|uniref:Ferric reductase-like transmembrane component family protein n=1 Tax=Tetrahymena thermophila (strain SB210) TaxID=312017 RepID=A4VE04_TETTS|nr:ferric reductase-like transmembrane component family protein [Tetrahymena thermophila SB210]EDK31757.1 ferric reductase-like transmembrane component family protein [Tetrahymena thermophila SB210]|eukprot:XP_001470775.1 ferric reductase-like transmembrane component family protein [Tetrahymena thermophila SB210]